MAEFVSAIVGLIIAGVKVGDSLYTLIDTFKDAPNEFLSLSNEVTNFRLVLSRIVDAHQSGELAVWDNKADPDVELTIKRSGRLLQEVEDLVQDVVKQQHGKDDRTQVNKIRWVRRVKRAQKLQLYLQAQKSSLYGFILMGML